MNIKVCGLKYVDNIGEVAALGPDYVGFICYDQSPRYMADLPPNVTAVPNGVVTTGVFVNEDADKVFEMIERYGFKAIQLHGTETPEYCLQFKGKVTVIKAFGVDADFNFEQLEAYKDVVDFFLFDTKTPAHGGSGETFDWEMLDRYKMNVPFFLSGGLSPDNISEVAKIKHPAFYGVDLNSKFEIEPGLKDISKLKEAFVLLLNE
ncbi:N-(5'-phosphoribosyl)anthranilate isomerase [Mucilaginibacter sp. MD40]|uniref:phosphoribosylanthranilate isomerase n=1 Tax=Mucilaginibacter sp. MD40 TaxID=2029590 RepID=UPI000BAC71B2|nr:phosphoribosylanthranilate isomerase [Mucilaginibacter sp. MD40]PAW93950.1 N-(5'-phosphoribosyl)anthranilate isomerase [Mucilaginibacter sp. MD40]